MKLLLTMTDVERYWWQGVINYFIKHFFNKEKLSETKKINYLPFI